MLLGVNFDQVATIRQARKGIEPDPVMAATLAILGGADGITIHRREDRRHIQDRDLKMLREFVPVELNLEMAATKEMVGIAIKTKPDLVTIVPEKRQELTTEGGLDVKSQRKSIGEAIKKLNAKDIPVSLFINPAFEDINLSKQINTDMVEIHTGMYANTKAKSQHEKLIRIMNAVRYTLDIGLTVNAEQ